MEMDVHHLRYHYNPGRYTRLLRRSRNHRPAEPLHLQGERLDRGSQTTRQSWSHLTGQITVPPCQGDHDQQALLDSGPRRRLFLECRYELWRFPAVVEEFEEVRLSDRQQLRKYSISYRDLPRSVRQLLVGSALGTCLGNYIRKLDEYAFELDLGKSMLKHRGLSCYTNLTHDSAAHLGRPRRRKVVRLLQSRLELRPLEQSLRMGQQHSARLSRNEIFHSGVHQYHGAVVYCLDEHPDVSHHRGASIPERLCFLVLHVDFADHWSASFELVSEAREVNFCLGTESFRAHADCFVGSLAEVNRRQASTLCRKRWTIPSMSARY
jgi:hypothetical protein